MYSIIHLFKRALLGFIFSVFSTYAFCAASESDFRLQDMNYWHPSNITGSGDWNVRGKQIPNMVSALSCKNGKVELWIFIRSTSYDDMASNYDSVDFQVFVDGDLLTRTKTMGGISKGVYLSGINITSEVGSYLKEGRLMTIHTVFVDGVSIGSDFSLAGFTKAINHVASACR